MASITVEKTYKASAEEIYYAFTNASLMSDWLCNIATVVPRPAGRMYLWWQGDYYSSGEYIALEENRRLVFKWHGRFDPEATEVEVMLTPRAGSTQIRLMHVVPDTQEWKERGEELRAEWTRSLDNLASVLATGKDLRAWNRPMLGIYLNDFNAAVAKQLNVPVDEGMRLDEPIQGMGAHKAGLKKDDVIVQVDDKKITNDFNTFNMALRGKKAGEEVKVTFYHGAEQKNITMELTPRPEPDIPWEAAGLGKVVRQKYDQALNALEAALKNASEAECEHNPAPGEWSVKETLAHLIHTERNVAFNLTDLITGFERIADDFGGHVLAHVQATVSAYPTVEALLNELKSNITENVALASRLPESFIARKSAYLNAAMTLTNIQSHMLSHIDQITATIQGARNKLQ